MKPQLGPRYVCLESLSLSWSRPEALFARWWTVLDSVMRRSNRIEECAVVVRIVVKGQMAQRTENSKSVEREVRSVGIQKTGIVVWGSQ